MAHKVDEYVTVADVTEGVELYLDILSRLCADSRRGVDVFL